MVKSLKIINGYYHRDFVSTTVTISLSFDNAIYFIVKYEYIDKLNYSVLESLNKQIALIKSIHFKSLY